MKKYEKPDIKTVDMAEAVLAALSLHDKVGYEQLGNETAFDANEQAADEPQRVNVWD